MRKLFEGHVIKNSRIDLSKASQLKKKMQKVQKEIQGKKKSMFCKLDKQLHSFIIQSSSNRRLRDFFLQIYDLIIMCFHLAKEIDRRTQEHIDLLDAILKQDYEKAYELLETHLSNSEDKVIGELERLQKKGIKVG